MPVWPCPEGTWVTLSCSSLSFVTYDRKVFRCRHTLCAVHHGIADGSTQTPWAFGDLTGARPWSHRIELSRQARPSRTFTLTYTPEVATFPPTECLQMRPLRSPGSDQVPLPPLRVDRTEQNWVPGLTNLRRWIQILHFQVSSLVGMVEQGRPKVTQRETAKIQAGCTFSTAIPHSVTALPFSQTGGNNGPVRLGFPVRELNVMETGLDHPAEEPSNTRRSWK